MLISSDMPEMIRLADRILVFKGGTIVGELDNSKAYDEMSRRIMSLIVGGRPPPEGHCAATGREEDRCRVNWQAASPS